MRKLISIILSALLLAIVLPKEAQGQIPGAFRPVYGNDNDLNRTISFVTENLVLDSLTYARLGSLKGHIRCTFDVNEQGKIINIRIAKGLAYWIDYEILVAMNSLPNMVPFKDKSGQPTTVKRDVYFTFNTDDTQNWPLYELPGLDSEITAQRREQAAKIAKLNAEWDEFLKDNTKLSLNGKGVYKPGVLTQNPLNLKNPPKRPPAKLTIRAE